MDEKTAKGKVVNTDDTLGRCIGRLGGKAYNHPIEAARALDEAFDLQVFLYVLRDEINVYAKTVTGTELNDEELAEMRTWLRGYAAGLAQEL